VGSCELVDLLGHAAYSAGEAGTAASSAACRVTLPDGESFDIGSDTRTPLALVEYRYEVPFVFAGTIDKLTLNLEPELVTGAQKMLHTVAKVRD
jgi:hypothetical protein